MVVAAVEAGDMMKETYIRLTVMAEAEEAGAMVAEAVAEVEAVVEVEAIPTKEEEEVEVDQTLFKELSLTNNILLKSMLPSHPKICPSYSISEQRMTLQEILVQ
jgi:hypothetical protein